MALNPKAGVFWVSLSGLVIRPDSGVTLAVLAVGGAVVISLLWHVFLAWTMSSGLVLRLYGRIRGTMDAILGLVLGGIGLRLMAAE
jgi:threonine/homoserine/homoserine lactone efflux protein